MNHQPGGKVWLAHETKHDTSMASAWGQPCYFNYRYVYPDELGEDGELPIPFINNMRRGVEGFNHVTDYFLLVGDMAQICAITAALAMRFPYFYVLRYDRQADGYIKVRINGHAP